MNMLDYIVTISCFFIAYYIIGRDLYGKFGGKKDGKKK